MTTQALLDFIDLAVGIATSTDLSLIAALHEAAHIYPELATITPDMPACKLVHE